MNVYIESVEWIRATINNLYALVTGMVMAVIGYLSPIADVVNLLVLLFFVDVIFGYWAARKLRKEKFSVKVIWKNTIPRMILSLTLVILAFMWDVTFNQVYIATYNIIAWFIAGVLIYSIAENGYEITKWNAFTRIQSLVSTNMRKETGIDLEDDKHS